MPPVLEANKRGRVRRGKKEPWKGEISAGVKFLANQNSFTAFAGYLT